MFHSAWNLWSELDLNNKHCVSRIALRCRWRQVTYVGVSLHTQDLIQQRGEAGENSDARAEAQ